MHAHDIQVAFAFKLPIIASDWVRRMHAYVYICAHMCVHVHVCFMHLRLTTISDAHAHSHTLYDTLAQSEWHIDDLYFCLMDQIVQPERQFMHASCNM